LKQEKLCLLMVEDNPDDARLIRYMLNRTASGKFEMEWADRLSAGLELLSSSTPDVILLDLDLPDSHGLEGLNRVRQQAPRIPIVVVTGLDDESTGISAIGQGAQEYLVKGKIDGEGLWRLISFTLERKKIEVELQESEERYRFLIDNIPLGVSVVLNGKITYCNRQIENITGFSLEELKSLNSFELVHPDDREAVQRNYMARISSREAPSNYKLRFKTSDGSFHWLDRVALAITWQGQPAVMLIDKDITESRKAEEELLKSASRLREAQALGRTGSWEYDFASGNISWSDEMFELYDRDKALGPPSYPELLSLYGPVEAEKWQEISAYVGQTGKEVQHELLTHLAGGKQFFSENWIKPVKDDAGKITGLFGTIQDVTERQQAHLKSIEAEALARANLAKSELLANVSHELRTPLASIKGFIETLIEQDVKWSQAQQLEFLQAADQEADRLTFLIRDLLDMSRLESGKIVLDKRTCPVSEILDSARPVLSVITAKHKLETVLNGDLPPLQVDRVRIAQVITNLVENAAKFSPEGSTIIVAVKGGPEGIIFSVEDRGEGISAEATGHLFNRFYQAERVASGKTRGTGLGLAICKGIVEAHGGRIWVESQPGAGSIFSFSLPVSKPE
jgi:PAS domain S-box-containing protein